LNLNGEGGAPRNLTLTDLASPVRIRALTEAIPIRWSWTHLTPSREYNLSATNGTTTVNASFATTAAGVGFVDVEQPRTNAANVTVYRLVGPLPPPNAAPTVDFVWAPTLGDTSTVFTFTAQASDDQDLPSSIQVRWDWTGDGTWDTAWSTTKTATHSYSSTGNKTVGVQGIDSGGLTATQSHVVQVTAQPPPPPPPPPPNGTNPVSTQTQILLLLASVSTPIMIVAAIGVIVYLVSRLRRARGRRG
jgi:hypothetical protein